MHHRQVEPPEGEAAVLDGRLEGVPEREGVHLLLLEGEASRRADADGEELMSFSGSIPTEAASALANGTEPEASAGTPTSCP